MFHSAIAHVEPVEHFVWFNASAGRTASIFGACPWFDGSGEENWEKVARGYTLRVEHKDGSVTYGLGRVPFDTFEAAAEFAAKINSR